MNPVSVFLAVLLMQVSLPAAELSVPPVFADHMVLQRDLTVAVWGEASPGEKVSVKIRGQEKAVISDKTGHWKVKLDPLSAGGPETLTITASKTITLRDVLVGDVWVCSGQSNMQWGLVRADGGVQAIAQSANPQLRICRLNHNLQAGTAGVATTVWAVSDPAAAKSFSAVPYWFGAKLQKELGVPVGIIDNSHSGTRLECWLSAGTLQQGPWPQDEFSIYEKARADYEAKYAIAKAKQDQELAALPAASRPKNPPHISVLGHGGTFRGPAVLWDGVVAPIAGYGIKGLVWNQGENNADFAGWEVRYFQLLEAFATLYRSAWGQGDFPLIIMQTATSHVPDPDPNKPSNFAEIRAAQLRFVQQDKKAALVVAVDQGSRTGDVHYSNKEPIAERLTRAVLGFVYGRGGEYSGPLFQTAEFRDGKAFVHFTHVGQGLVAKDGPLANFALAGEDKIFHPAEAVIQGDVVAVSTATVSRPVAMRYAWADTPAQPINLFNREGFPASPFRTDLP